MNRPNSVTASENSILSSSSSSAMNTNFCDWLVLLMTHSLVQVTEDKNIRIGNGLQNKPFENR